MFKGVVPYPFHSERFPLPIEDFSFVDVGIASVVLGKHGYHKQAHVVTPIRLRFNLVLAQNKDWVVAASSNVVFDPIPWRGHKSTIAAVFLNVTWNW